MRRAVLGLACAVAIGVLIYGGGVRLNLARFFRITGFVLVLVAAGLVASTLHSAHEAGWLNAGQGQALDLTWLVVPGTWTSALLTGMLGWQPLPTHAELIGYVVYLIPAAVYVLWPAGVKFRARAPMTSGTAVVVLLLVLVLAGCGGADSKDAASGAGAKTVGLELTDLEAKDPELEADIADRFDAVQKELATLGPGGTFPSYDSVDVAERKQLAQVVDALARPMAKISGALGE